jgi:hypothetical protein
MNEAFMDLTRDSFVTRARELLVAAVDNELVLLDTAQGKYYGIDAIGSEIWNRLEAPARIGDLCVALGTEFEADAETIERDVLCFLERLAGYQLVEVTAQ